MKITAHQRRLLLDIGIAAAMVLFFMWIKDGVFNIINPFVYALILAYMLNPLIALLERKKVKRIYGIILVFLTFFLVVFLLAVTFIPRLVSDASRLANNLPEIFRFVTNFIIDLRAGDIAFIPDIVYDFVDIEEGMDQMASMLRKGLSDFSSMILASTSGLLTLIMTPIITFYYLKDKDRILKGFFDFIGSKKTTTLLRLAKDIDKVLGGFIKGQLTVALFVGILTGIGTAIIGVPNALTIGLVAGLTNIIPYFGPWLGGILPVVLALMTEPIMALWVVLLMVGVQQVESSFISPQIMSQSVGLHPLTVMFSVLLFGNLFGIAGMIIGVPLMGTIKVLFQWIMKYRERVRKQAGNE
ncbi:MAG TPA: hypothetical protein DHN33_03235 [Eubacteriaceae bacterium]|nr:hypothetical protein [Eubacteriaceae bacterium]